MFFASPNQHHISVHNNSPKTAQAVQWPQQRIIVQEAWSAVIAFSSIALSTITSNMLPQQGAF
jgi:hypothetical protein